MTDTTADFKVAFLPTPSDPFLLKLWLKYYKIWGNEVDRLYIHANNCPNPRIIDYIRFICSEFDNIEIFHFEEPVEHGDALTFMTKQVKAPLIMFVEDDGFIFKPGQVSKCFDYIASGEYDALGSKRGSCSQWLYDRLSDMFVIDNRGYGDHGPNFWPNFFFVKRKDLMETNLKFGAKLWKKGSYVKELNDYTPEDVAGDTFVWGSMQLRNLDLNFKYVPQYHGNTDDDSEYRNRLNIWDGQCPWLHAGSLSSGFHGLLNLDTILDPKAFPTDAEKLELERRLVFWEMAYEEALKDEYIKDIKMDYYKGLTRLYRTYNLNKNRVLKRINMYKEVMNVHIQR